MDIPYINWNTTQVRSWVLAPPNLPGRTCRTGRTCSADLRILRDVRRGSAGYDVLPTDLSPCDSTVIRDRTSKLAEPRRSCQARLGHPASPRTSEEVNRGPGCSPRAWGCVTSSHVTPAQGARSTTGGVVRWGPQGASARDAHRHRAGPVAQKCDALTSTLRRASSLLTTGGHGGGVPPGRPTLRLC